MNDASNSPNPSKRKRDISNLTSTPGKRLFCDDSQSSTQMSQDEDNVAVASSQSTCATVDSSQEMFDKNDDEFDEYMAQLSDEVMCGSQPLPDMQEERGIDMNQFPDHILEIVFSCLPIYDMVRTCPLVCSRWNNIIMKKEFMPWKKLYHKLRMNDTESLVELESIMEASNMGHSKPEAEVVKPFLVLNLIRFMGNWRNKVVQSTELDMLATNIQRHHLFQLANSLLEKKILSPDSEMVKQPLATNNPRLWMLIAIIMILSPDVKSLHHFHHILTASLPISLVSDFFYSVASVFWAQHLFLLASQENHFKIIAALSILENTSLPLPLEPHKKGLDRENMPTHSSQENVLTHEQLKVVSHVFQVGHLVRVMAYAGAGKTSTLIAVVKAKPNQSFMYTSFSKAVVEEGRKAFHNHSNVNCSTLHSLAYRGLDMQRYTHKIDRRNGMTPSHIIMKLGLQKEDAFLGSLIKRTLLCYMASSDHRIKLRHVPRTRLKKNNNVYVREDLSNDLREALVRMSTKYWNMITDFTSKDCMMTDDCYLKLWQMTSPEICGYDVILLDEAQDCTECMRDILVRQVNKAALVLVGDSHQQIYGFRRATDALTLVRHTHSYYLTQSFRFGTEIAQVADSILRGFKFNGFIKTTVSPNMRWNSNVSQKTLLGVGNPGTVCGQELGKPYCVLCRTNVGVIKTVVAKLGDAANVEKQIVVVGGAAKLGLNLIMDLYALSIPMQQRRKQGIYIKNTALRKYGSLNEVLTHATLEEDQGLVNNVGIVKLYGDRTPHIVQQLRNLPTDLDNADIVVSTVHKAKGLEFDTVSVCDDFASNLLQYISEGKEMKWMSEEANLLYVAATRPRKSLIMSPTLCTLLKKSHIRFLVPKATSEYFENSKVQVFCAECKQPLSNDTVLTFERPEIRAMQDGGPLCFKCICVCAPGWDYLASTSEAINLQPLDGDRELDDSMPDDEGPVVFGQQVAEWFA